ncbi:putative Cyclin M transmembrane N-terminal domain containing protein [Leishmania naiffi]|uniref:Cyclin M transmembrane N-terminal domain containing protein n=1 Tax=Leishmania naiffi TaxID=5678 RepID=A0AAW3BW79_9TRYP
MRLKLPTTSGRRATVVLSLLQLIFVLIVAFSAGGSAQGIPTNDSEDVVPAGKPDESLGASGWMSLIVVDSVLLLFAALFAGLTLALLGLDTLSLEIIADSGSEPDKTYAQKILPIRHLGNQLLCTLILGNVMVNTLIAQITDSHIHGWVATVISTALTTFGGEVIPQALMSAHALQVGSKSAPLVKFFVFIFWPVCKPLSMILDKFIGKDPGQIYERNELKKLMFMHAARSAESGIGAGEVDLMVGAMELHEKTVMEVMTPVSDMLMLEANERLSEETIQLISDRGHSRIPVYQTTKNNVIGVLFAKDLLMANPQENTKVLLLVKFYNRRCHVVPSETKLISMLRYFQTGKSHIALVQEVQQRPYGDPYYEVKGLVTMEDIIEELIHSEIFDEYDIGPHQIQHTALASTSNLSKRQVGLTSKCSRRVHLNHNELRAAALFLCESLSELRMEDVSALMQGMEECTTVYRVRAPKDSRGMADDDKQNVWLYREGVPSSVFTLVVSGRVEVFAGKEPIALEMGSWSLLSTDALSSDLFVPTFSCRVVQDSTIMQITREAYVEMLHICNNPVSDTSRTTSSAANMNHRASLDSL